MSKILQLFKNIPDFTSWDEALRWIREGQETTLMLAPSLISEAEVIALDWSDIEQKKDPVFGYYSSEKWRKFVLATFLADRVSYTDPVDQVNFDRLLFVMHAFPQGFRSWWIHVNNSWWPVGYTAWYPMLETMYELFEKSPDKLKDRMVVPNDSTIGQKPYIYLFNYSVAPTLKKSQLTKLLLKRYAQDIHAQNARGLACITVSNDGVRVASRFGLSFSGNLILDGSPEGVYVTHKKDSY